MSAVPRRMQIPLWLFAGASALLLFQIAIRVVAGSPPQPNDDVSRFLDIAIVPCVLGGTVLLLRRTADSRVTALALIATGLMINRLRADPFWPVLLTAGILASVAATTRINESAETQSEWRLPGKNSAHFKVFIAVLIALLVVHGAVSIHVLRNSYPPRIDTFSFLQSSVEALARGQDPYGRTQLDIYDEAGTRVYYSPANIGPDGRVLVGLQYPPATLISAVPGYLLGDVRYGFMIAILLSACLIFALMPDIRGLAVVAFLLLNPRTFFVEELCWTEPLVWLFFCATMFAAAKVPRLTPIAAGLLLASKQYNVLALPLLALLCPVPLRPGRTLATFGKTLAVCSATLLPFVLWNYHGLWHDLVVFHAAQPFRKDALSLAVIDPWLQKLSVPLLLCYYVWVYLRPQKQRPGFGPVFGAALLLFFAFSKQAFLNYYFLISLIFILSGALNWPLPAFEQSSNLRGVANIVRGAAFLEGNGTRRQRLT
jgi:hypothetical protein